ncbi:hypothetical protein A2U01_0103719, partial [Trifolium medium]|nr:hypothetical protein [Trifolium medium]
MLQEHQEIYVLCGPVPETASNLFLHCDCVAK